MSMIIGSGITIGPGITLSQSLASGLITNGLLFNLDMQNYVSGTTWPDSSGNNNNFTFYQAPTGSSYGTVYNTGTNQAYWSSPGNNRQLTKSKSTDIFKIMRYTHIFKVYHSLKIKSNYGILLILKDLLN